MAEIPLTALRVGQSGTIVGLSGGREFIQRMREKGILKGRTVERMPTPTVRRESLSTRVGRFGQGRNRGRIKGQGLGILQIQVKIRETGYVVTFGRGEASQIIVETQEKIKNPRFQSNPA